MIGSSLLILALLGLLIYLKLNSSNTPPADKKLPPGPPGLPIIGNLHQLNRSAIHHTFSKWSEEYGSVFMVRFLAQDWLVLNTVEAMHEAMIVKGDAFSGRLRNFRSWVRSQGHRGIFSSDPTLPWWKPLRKVAHKSIRQYSSGMNHIEEVVGDFLQQLMVSFEAHHGDAFDPRNELYNFTMSSIVHMLLGEKLQEGSEKFKQWRKIERTYSKTLGPNIHGVLLDSFPWLRFLGNNVHERLTKASDSADTIVSDYLRDDQHGETPNNVLHDLQQMMIGNKKDNIEGIDEADIKVTLQDLIFAGIVTTSTSIYALINILVHYPQVTRKLQGEIDEVVGQSRVVSVKDRECMPYARATVYELLRYSSVLPVGVTHRTLSDTEINGSFVPAGTNVAPNLWQLHHDEKFWGDPWQFRPERFLDEEGQLLPADHPNRRHLMAFGAGRRVCVGEVFALTRLFLFTANLLQKFDLLPANDQKLVPCDPRTYEAGIILSPKDYKLKMITRK